MTKHQPKTFMGIDLAQATVGFIDLGVSVEEAPEAPEPATDAPRTVTVESIEAKIAREDYLIGINGGTLTICVLTLANGFDVTGESACVDPANFNEALGKKYARADAFKKIWPLEGYLLREKMWQDSYPDPRAPVTECEPGMTSDMARAQRDGADGSAAEDYCDRFGMDGAKWAAGFRKTAISLGYSAMDEGWLIGWFCNAVMAGYDEARRRYEPTDVSPAPKADTGRAADEGWDDPEAASDAAFHGSQPDVANAAMDGQWLRQRAYELAQVANGHLHTLELIERARQIEGYIGGTAPEIAAEDSESPVDVIQHAKQTLVNAVLRGEAPACDQAGDAIQAMADWLNDAGVAD